MKTPISDITLPPVNETIGCPQESQDVGLLGVSAPLLANVEQASEITMLYHS